MPKSEAPTQFKTTLKSVITRKGEKVDFTADRIFEAICAAALETGEFKADQAAVITKKVVRILEKKYKSPDSCPSIEEIQDTVELTLANNDHFETARAYIMYRQKRDLAREDDRVMIDVQESMEDYLKQLDWRVNENANQGYSLGGMILNNAGKITANYWLSHVYPKEIGEAHRNGDYHIHDLSMLAGYCAGWSLRTLLEEGFNGVPGFIESGAPKHLSAAVGQMVNFMGTLQNEFAGAQAFSSVDTYLAPYIKLDNLPYERVKQCMQELIFNLNVPSRWGTQTPFTNFTFDWVCPEDLRSVKPLIGGKPVDFTYADLQEEMDMINRSYIEVMTEGDIKGRPFTFPIPTYNITNDFPWESPAMEPLFEMTAKYGLPYFQNFVNSDLKPTDVRSMCCRLRLDVKELLKRGNGLFGSAEQTGSIGVVTINCARLGYLFKGNKEALLARLDQLLNMAKKSLEIKRKTIKRLLDGGLYPFTKRYLGTFNNHFSTIGVNAMNEMIRNFTRDQEDITTEAGQRLANEVLDHIRDRMVQFQEETGNLYNLEATPAEGAMYRFAREDKKRFDDIIQAGTPEAPFYTNSSQIPVGYTDDPFKALDLQETLQSKYTGGTVLHMYMGERLSSADAAKKFIKKVFENYTLPYLTITPTFSICPKHGYLPGEHEFCPKCDAEIEQEKTSCPACEISETGTE